MKNALILHGICDRPEYFDENVPSPSNAHWLPWLQEKFLRDGVLCRTPEMPAPYAPRYDEWEKIIDQFAIDQNTVIVAHSAGCGFILKWLSHRQQVSLKKLVLVAPWLDPRCTIKGFLEGDLDEYLPQRVDEMRLFYSNDETVEGVAASKDIILSAYPGTKLHLFENMGHFCLGDMNSRAFPSLWDVVK